MTLQQFRYYTRWHQFANRREYDAPADPWELLSVAPADVDRYTSVSLKWGLGRVTAGEWDTPSNHHSMRDTVTWKGLEQRFEKGDDWEETALYQREKERFEDGKRVRGFESLEEFREKRCPRIDDLFEDIRENGYRPNYGTVYETPEDADYIHDLEPLVVIGRDGDIYWTEGYHRLTIASILNVEEIPVYVLQRHERWQRIRDEVRGAPDGDLPARFDAYRDHPDLHPNARIAD